MKRKRISTLLLLLATPAAFAQTNGGTGKGLDQLDEQQVMATLANNNLSTLLNRDFEKFKIPPDQQEQVLTLIKLKQLQNPVGLNVAGRRALAVTVAKGLEQLLPKATDPALLMEQTNELFSSAIVPEVTVLEYFGENPVAQAALKPVAETAKTMYQRVAALADAKEGALANGITQQNQAQRVPDLLKMRQTKLYGIYSDNMATYALCISLPKSDEQRQTLADATIKYLKQYDTPDTGVQPTIRMQIGKLQLVKGDYAAAKATFDTISRLKDLTPLPETSQQNDARYFGIVAEISARKLKDAQTHITDLDSWEAINYLPNLGPGDQASVKAALAMLKFRLYSAQSDLTNDEDEKKKTNDQAIAVLSNLVKEQPGLKDLVYDQMIGRIPENPDLTTLNPLILQALQQQGFDEVIKKPDETVDSKKLARAIAAAQEIERRKGQPGIDDSSAELSAYFVAYAFDRLKQQKEAAAAFMDFAEKYPNDRVKATDAMDHATALIGELRKKDRAGGEPDPETRNLYDRFLPLAINPPFNRQQFAFQYAALLQAERKFKDAVKYFQLVPDSDKKYQQSQYLQMLALTQELGDAGLTGDDRRQVVTQILNLTGEIEKLPATATTAEQKKTYLEWVTNADEIAADLTRRELKDPAKSLAMLEGFETRIDGAPDAYKAHVQALQLRINDYMDLGRIDDATKTLVSLLSANPEEGQALMFGVLKTVDHDMDVARSSGNIADLKKLAQDRADLSGFVVSWAGKSKDPAEQARLPQYQLYDADSKREAAELLDDPTARKARLEEALKEYQDLNQKDPNNLAAQLGLGLTNYSLGHYQQAIDFLAPLIDVTKALQPTEEVTTNGITQRVENTQFWEANFKRLKSLVELYKQNPTDPQNQKDLTDANSYIGSLYIINGQKTGGKNYRDDFEKLRVDIAQLLKK
jgi:flagellar biosynthesis chaperone FliJ